METLKSWFAGLRGLLDRKLGTCPKCMAGSIAGSALSWPVVAVFSLARVHPVAVMFVFAVATAFTLLTLAHLVVHMFRVAPLLRHVTVNSRPGCGPAPSPSQSSRREFALLVARAGYGFAAAAVGMALLPQRAAAGANASSCVYQVALAAGSCLNLANKQVCFKFAGSCPSYSVCVRSYCKITLSLVASNVPCPGVVLTGSYACQ